MQSDYDFEQGGPVEVDRNERDIGKTVVDGSSSVDFNLPFESTLSAMIQDQVHSDYLMSDFINPANKKAGSDFNPFVSQVQLEESNFPSHSFSETKHYSSSISEISYQIELSPREEQQVQDRSETTISYSRSSDYYLSSDNNDTHDHSGHSLDTLQELNSSKSHLVSVHPSVMSGDGIGSSELYEGGYDDPENINNTSSLIFDQLEGKEANYTHVPNIPVLNPSHESSLPLPPPPTTGFYSNNNNKPASTSSPSEFPPVAHYSPPPIQSQRLFNPYATQSQPQPLTLFQPQPREAVPAVKPESFEPSTDAPSYHNQSPSSYAEFVSPQQGAQLIQNSGLSPLTNESDEHRSQSNYENPKQVNENITHYYNYSNYPQQSEKTHYDLDSNYYNYGGNSNQREEEGNSEVPFDANYEQSNNNTDESYSNGDFLSPTYNEISSMQTNYYSTNSSDYPTRNTYKNPNYSQERNQGYEINEKRAVPMQSKNVTLNSSSSVPPSTGRYYNQLYDNQATYSLAAVSQNPKNDYQDYYRNQSVSGNERNYQSEENYQLQDSSTQPYADSTSSYDVYYAEELSNRQSEVYDQNYLNYDYSSSDQPFTRNNENQQTQNDQYEEQYDQYNQYYSNTNSYEQHGEEGYQHQYSSNYQNYSNSDNAADQSNSYYDNENYYYQQQTEELSKEENHAENYYSNYQTSEYESPSQWDYSNYNDDQYTANTQEQRQNVYDYQESGDYSEQPAEYYSSNTAGYNNSYNSSLNQSSYQKPAIVATVNPVNPDISSDSDEDAQRGFGMKERNKGYTMEQNNRSTSNPIQPKQSFRIQEQEQALKRSSYDNDDSTQSTVEPNQSTTTLSPTPVVNAQEQSDAEKKLRHLQIWERFFENAAKMSDNEGTSSDTNNNPKNRLKMSLLRLSHEKNAANRQSEDTLTDGYPARPNPSSFPEGTISATSSEDLVPPPGSPSLGNQIDFNSGISKQYFTFAIAAEQTWPVLISSKKYQTLLALAKASIGTVNNRQIIPYMGLFAAAIMEDMESVNFFLMRGINPNCRDQVRRTIVHHVARVGNEKILALLFDSSAELDVIDQIQQFTPLHIAVIFNRLSIVRFLLDSAVDVSRRTSGGLTALDLARQRRHSECEKLISDFMQYSSIYSFDQLASINDQMNKSDSENRKDSSKGLVSDSDSSQQRFITNPPPTKPPAAKKLVGEVKPRGKTPIVLSGSGSSVPEVNPEAINYTMTETYSYQGQLNYTKTHQVSIEPLSNSQQPQLLPIEDKISKKKKSSNHANLNTTSEDQLQQSSGAGRKVSFDLNKFKQKEKEILEKRKELEKKVEKTKLSLSLPDPDEINSDDDYIPSDPSLAASSVNTSQSFTAASSQVSHNTSQKSNQHEQEGEEEEQEDNEDQDQEQEESTLSLLSKLLDRFSSSIWSIAVSILSLTLFLLMNKSSKTSDSGGKKKLSRNKKELEEEEVLQLIGSRGNTSIAPPTDEELLKRGLSVGAATISPTGAQVRAPHDVQLAIAMSKAGKKLVGSPVASSKEHLETVETVKKEIANRYSLGNSLPQGTSWRYVNVMDLNSKKNQ